LKEDISKILDGNTPLVNKEIRNNKPDGDKSPSSLAQEFAKLRASNKTTPKSRTDSAIVRTPFQFSDLLKDKENDREKAFLKSNTVFSSFSTGDRDNLLFPELPSREKKLIDQLPLSKLYEIQDLFYNVSDREFNELSSEYIEELIKLSSVVMHRVKNSNYYTKS